MLNKYFITFRTLNYLNISIFLTHIYTKLDIEKNLFYCIIFNINVNLAIFKSKGQNII